MTDLSVEQGIAPGIVAEDCVSVSSCPESSSAGVKGVRRWYVVHTQPKNEIRAIANLDRQGFQTFCPTERRTVRHARKATEILAPLFPSYVFVQLNRSLDQWRSINGTRGVIRLITNGDEPVALPNGIVEDLQRRIGVEGVIDWTVQLKAGDQIAISEGPFAMMTGTLQHLDSAGRVQILLDLLGRVVRVSVAARAISPI